MATPQEMLDTIRQLIQPINDRIDNFQIQITQADPVNVLNDVIRVNLQLTSVFAMYHPPSFSGSMGECFSDLVEKLVQSMLIQ